MDMTGHAELDELMFHAFEQQQLGDCYSRFCGGCVVHFSLIHDVCTFKTTAKRDGGTASCWHFSWNDPSKKNFESKISFIKYTASLPR